MRKRQTEIEAQIGEKLSAPLAGAGLVRTASGKSGFLKCGVPSDTYRCEANGLRELQRAGAIATAQVWAVGESYILTEYIPQRSPSGSFFEVLGRKLAHLHRLRSPHFGFYEDNYIGNNPQPNLPTEREQTDWPTFYFHKRLLFQYKLAEQHGLLSSRLKTGFARLESRIEVLLAGSEEPPTLLHGDLWRGNVLCNEQNEALLIDPAVYYGHREADLAMTRLFGGFPPSFYLAYHREYPLAEGWEQRENLYKLYHLLNHLNLFGRGYLAEAEAIVSAYTR